ncbi:MAG: single-stranded DNA-binding protein [Firmicutes bacterium]|nr:single-stranded DNA-binding protein [Bacillota bacterium]
MNKVILLGRLARDPEVRYTQGAEPLAVCRFSIAVDRPQRRNDQASGNDRTADFISCVCFGRRGETISQYFKKGNRIAVSGRLQTGDYTDSQGNKRYTTDVIVEEFDFCESKDSAAASSSAYSSPAPSPAPAQSTGFYPVDESGDDEDLPF